MTILFGKHVITVFSYINNHDSGSNVDFSFYPFRFHSLGHKVICIHGSHPLANGGTGFGNLGNGGWLEFIIIYVGLD